MTGEAADSVVDSLANIYESARHSENPEELFNNILDTMRAIDTTAPEKQIDPTALSPRLKTLYENLEALRQCPKHIDNTLNTMPAHYNKTHDAPKGSIFQIAQEHYNIIHPVSEYLNTESMDTQARKTIYKKIKELPGKIRENPQKAITCCLAGLAVAGGALTMGCTDKPEDVQKEVNTHIYVDMGQEGDPEEQIHDFYDIALEEAGKPVIKPLAQYAAEYELDPETGQVIPGTLKIYDSGGNPVDQETALAMQGNIARGGAGNIITDAALLDLHIEEIGKNKYEISGIAPYLEHDGYKYKIDYYYNSKVNDKPNRLTDAKIDTDNGKGEITSGFFVAEDEEGVEQVYALFIADEEAERQNISIKNGRRENSKYINSFAEIHGFPGISSYVINMSDINEGTKGENRATILSPGMMSELLDRKDDDRVHFSIAKEKL